MIQAMAPAAFSSAVRRASPVAFAVAILLAGSLAWWVFADPML